MVKRKRVLSESKSSTGSTESYPKITKKTKQISACKNWCFTLFNYTDALILLFDGADRYAFQEEICPETKRPHLQGYCEWDKRVRPLSRIAIVKIKWFKCLGNRDSNIEYCTKLETRAPNGRHWLKGLTIPLPLIDPMAGHLDHLYEYQQKILDIIKGPVDSRKIYWFWDKNGNVGKTDFAKHLVIKYGAAFLGGKGADVKCAVASRILKKGINSMNVAIFHFTRTIENYVSYESLEAIKDSVFFSGKFESDECVYNKGHILVFANFEPEYAKMSQDRWDVCEIVYS